jgi:hypothetical protein
MKAMTNCEERKIFDGLNHSDAKYYIPTEHFTFEIIVSPSKVESFSNNIYRRKTKDLAQSYKLCDSKRYKPTYNMTVYLSKKRKHDSLDDNY